MLSDQERITAGLLTDAVLLAYSRGAEHREASKAPPPTIARTAVRAALASARYGPDDHCDIQVPEDALARACTTLRAYGYRITSRHGDGSPE